MMPPSVPYGGPAMGYGFPGMRPGGSAAQPRADIVMINIIIIDDINSIVITIAIIIIIIVVIRIHTRSILPVCITRSTSQRARPFGKS